MGSNASPDETPHPIYLSAFRIDRYEVTQEKFEKVMADNPSDFSGAHRPVERVTWYEARDYCKQLGKRLPTEAEWEKATRGGTATTFYWGDAMDDRHAWYWDNAEDVAHPVKSKKPNAWGLYDMVGNVAEWCDPSIGEEPMTRGGHFMNKAPEVGFTAREGYQKEWQLRDAQIPKSEWWLSDGQMIGLRVVCEG